MERDAGTVKEERDDRLSLMSDEKSKNPYFIENISTNIYTMEELCFYMSQNLYLLDETILNGG